MTIAENIHNADDLRREEVEEWGETFYLRELRAAEVDKITTFETGSMKQTAAYVVAAAVDVEGRQVFQWQDIDKLCQRNFRKLNALAVKVIKFNGLDENTSEALEGNSEPTPSE